MIKCYKLYSFILEALILKKILISIILLSMVILCSCESGKPLNMEADIISIDFVEDIIPSSIQVTSSTINIYLDKNVDVSALTPIITITEGASIFPPSNVIQDFRNKVTYTVTSEDGNWKQVYNVKIFPAFSWEDGFENWVKGYNDDFEVPLGWATANAGISILNKLLPEHLRIKYPTYKSTDAYLGDFAVELQTRRGLDNSEILPKLISGSIFIGSFNTSFAMIDKLKCPQLGAAFQYDESKRPDKLAAWIKYTPGKIYQNEYGEPDPNCIDTCAFYAILFEGVEPLTSYEIKASDRIIAKADMKSLQVSNIYSYVEVPFEYRREIPTDVPLQMTIVASSSKDGDFFKGAYDSKLNIDNVKIIFK